MSLDLSNNKITRIGKKKERNRTIYVMIINGAYTVNAEYCSKGRYLHIVRRDLLFS